MARRSSRPPGLPSRHELLSFIQGSETPVGKREIARAFGLRGADRIDLKAMLRELEAEGLVERGRSRRLGHPGLLPEVAVVQIIGTDADGEVIGVPGAWRGDEPAPTIYMAPERPGTPTLAPGMKVLARLRRLTADTYEGRPIRILSAAPMRLLGVYEVGADGRGLVRPTSRRERDAFLVPPDQSEGALAGDLVLIEAQPGRRPGMRPGPRLGTREARIVRRIGSAADPKSISLISILTHDLPVEFSPEALALAARAPEPTLEGRIDLRDVPLVTIDGADARDFDDAVWAEADPDPGNPGGWHLLVAIADVAWYVRPGDALDRDAYERGNSVYFPDRVVPMLPEALSSGLCSLRPGENRACLAAHLWIDAQGRIRRHRFLRGLMRSAARLTYEQVQNARDGRPDDLTGPLLEPVIAPLYGAFEALLQARRRRGTLELDLPERQVILGRDGHIRAVVPRARLDSHRLIEEFMIAANVAAAETLERLGMRVMYRLHAKPDMAKVEALRGFLAEIGIRMPAGQLARPRHFTQLLARVADEPFAAMVNELVLRSQAQAVYGPENIGHFGLALQRYAHFTSPIRRYADLLVHRALISGLRLGEGGLPAGAEASFAEAGEHISETERRAAAAEREAIERFTAAYLAGQIGEVFAGRIVGVTRFGLFVRLEETGADGLVPVATLPADYYDHDERRHQLVGRRSGRAYSLGDAVEVRLVTADPITGGLVLQVMEAAPMPRRAMPQRGRRSEAGRARGPGRKGGERTPQRRGRAPR